MFDRVISFIGEDKYNLIKDKTVMIVGIGGVGEYTLESLARSGIEKFILIDYDKIDESNLNRQIVTDSSNIGLYKVEEAKKRILKINPKCNIICLKEKIDHTNINLLDNYKFDYLVDTCDSVEAKKLLIDYYINHDIKFISSMGTAKKINPNDLSIIDIKKTSYDPLAKIMRKYVLSLKTKKKIMVVSSIEKPIDSKILASLIFVPATAGLLIGNYIIKDIIK